MVAPMLVKIGEPLAEVQANYNRDQCRWRRGLARSFFTGKGRADAHCFRRCRGHDRHSGRRTAITFETLKLWADGHKRVDFASPGDLEGRFYMRFDVVDQPGVLGQIIGRLGQHGISIASVYQHESQADRHQTVPIVHHDAFGEGVSGECCDATNLRHAHGCRYA